MIVAAAPSSRPMSRLRNALGESAIIEVANCLNAAGSGFTAASDSPSLSRITSSTMR